MPPRHKGLRKPDWKGEAEKMKKKRNGGKS
jgi:hypothetical protein